MTRWQRFNLWLDKHGFATWEHVHLEWTYYGRLRQSGLSHKEAIRELDEMWAKRVAEIQLNPPR